MADKKSADNQSVKIGNLDPEEMREMSKAALEAVTKAGVNAEEAARDIAVKIGEAGLDVATGNLGKNQPSLDDESFSVTTYFFGKDNEFWEDMQRNGVQPRRFFLYTGLSAAVAVGGNLFGVTSALLGAAPELAERSQLDVLYPVKGFKRCVNKEHGFEFVYPQEWLADQAVALAEQAERVRQLDPPSVEDAVRRRRGRALVPLAAFGPPGASGAGAARENVSVVRSTLERGFSLRGTLGAPEAAARRLLNEAIAPEGSGREAELLSAIAEARAGGAPEVYVFEYTIKTSRLFLHNICVIAARGDELFTLTAVAPQEQWASKRAQARRIADSFRLTR